MPVLQEALIQDCVEMSADSLAFQPKHSPPKPLELPALNFGDRKELPTRRAGFNQKVAIDGQNVYLRTGEYSDGTLGEIWIDVAKQGAGLRQILHCLAQAISIGLQHGTPLETFVKTFSKVQFEPSGLVQGSETVEKTSSILDYVVKELEKNYL